jgi:hypothetical protein
MEVCFIEPITCDGGMRLAFLGIVKKFLGRIFTTVVRAKIFLLRRLHILTDFVGLNFEFTGSLRKISGTICLGARILVGFLEETERPILKPAEFKEGFNFCRLIL